MGTGRERRPSPRRSEDATSTLKAITVPTLIVAGDQDTTCKPEASARMRQDIPDARQVTLTPARHLGLIEHHASYGQSVQDFARGVVAVTVIGVN